MTPDGKTLVGIMQFPLYNPSAVAIAGSLAIRILTFDISSGKTKQYVYLMESAGLQAISDIARDLRGADNGPARIFDGRDGQGDIEKGAVFAPAFRLEMLNPLALPEPRENVELFLLTIHGNEQSRHWLPNRFVGCVPEQTLRTLVPTGNDSIQIFTDDRVVGGVHDGAEERRSSVS